MPCQVDYVFLLSRRHNVVFRNLWRSSCQIKNCFETHPRTTFVLNTKKCLSAGREAKILGHLVSGNGDRLDPDKAKAVSNFPIPKNVHDAKSFLGLCSYFRWSTKGFCYLAKLLKLLLKVDAKVHWGFEETEAFNKLKEAHISYLVLRMYNESDPIEIHANASKYNIGATLAQIQENDEKVIANSAKSQKELFYYRTGMPCSRTG